MKRSGLWFNHPGGARLLHLPRKIYLKINQSSMSNPYGKDHLSVQLQPRELEMCVVRMSLVLGTEIVLMFLV